MSPLLKRPPQEYDAVVFRVVSNPSFQPARYMVNAFTISPGLGTSEYIGEPLPRAEVIAACAELRADLRQIRRLASLPYNFLELMGPYEQNA